MTLILTGKCWHGLASWLPGKIGGLAKTLSLEIEMVMSGFSIAASMGRSLFRTFSVQTDRLRTLLGGRCLLSVLETKIETAIYDSNEDLDGWWAVNLTGVPTVLTPYGACQWT